MRFDRLTVLGVTLELGAVPTFTPLDGAAARRVVGACSDVGARVIEVTNRAEGTVELFRGLAAWSAVEHPSVILGGGTVYEAPTAALFIDAGANFIVGPIFNADVARLCNRRRVAYLPGCGTAGEISAAEELGVEIVKLFPAAAIDGPAFVRGILGPSPWTRIMPTNVAASEEAVRSWFASGIACVGVGPALITNALQANREGTMLKERIGEFMSWVRAAREAADGRAVAGVPAVAGARLRAGS